MDRIYSLSFLWYKLLTFKTHSMWFILSNENKPLINFRTRRDAEQALGNYPEGCYVCPPSKLIERLSDFLTFNI